MKISKINIFFFLSILLCSFAAEASAQNTKKMAGKWESVFRKGKRNCDFDFTMTFREEGKATISNGSRFSECSGYSSDIPNWEVTKELLEFKGKNKRWDVIKISGPEGSKNIIVEVFEGDFMKIHMEVVSEDTTVIRSLIMKKVA